MVFCKAANVVEEIIKAAKKLVLQDYKTYFRRIKNANSY
jgi:hypothetical protein